MKSRGGPARRPAEEDGAAPAAAGRAAGTHGGLRSRRRRGAEHGPATRERRPRATGGCAARPSPPLPAGPLKTAEPTARPRPDEPCRGGCSTSGARGRSREARAAPGARGKPRAEAPAPQSRSGNPRRTRCGGPGRAAGGAGGAAPRPSRAAPQLCRRGRRVPARAALHERRSRVPPAACAPLGAPPSPHGRAAGLASAPALGRREGDRGCYLRSLHGPPRARETEVRPQAAQAPATATLSDPTELRARADHVTSARTALGFSRLRTPERRPWEVLAPGHFRCSPERRAEGRGGAGGGPGRSSS
ncbi:translation initiation factor IF-2-like [Canis lupus familiaris]|uniref:translation initiation factor IF-2-like n=1 Tax=Canis lupus familiaris TaxID=9615 RepID=UPI000DC74A6E|nr:translation initiation factor IF-2-like [Canis lupus familiaris]XP_038540425.1 translation initiation factor IF-2-like [Canis lupus familiaris]XP_048948251.1 translation initiation factor IF-2-like [Canis lupus dingo]